MDLESLESALKKASGLEGKFETLQALITGLMFQQLMVSGTPLPKKLYEWYVGHLVEIYNALVKRHNESGPNYQIGAASTRELSVKASIEAILATVPEGMLEKKKV